MRIAMLLGRSTGGIGTHVRELAAELGALGEQVEIISDSSTIERFGLDDAQALWPRRSLADLTRLRGRFRAAVAGADLVHAHGLQAGLLATTLGPRGLPVVVSLHNDLPWTAGPRGRAAALAARTLARRARLVTGASSDLVADARSWGARWTELALVPSPRVPALLAAPPLSDADRAERAEALLRGAGIAPSGPLVLTLSRIAPQKDLDTLVRAAAALDGVTWVVGGDGDTELAATLRATAVALGAQVHFVGRIDNAGDWLRAAEVFALSSRWEARALVVQEAMAAGTPVVCPAVGGLVDLAEGIGRLVPAADPAELARAVGGLLRDPAARHTASEAGRARAGTWPDGEQSARSWRGWYEQAASIT